MIDYLKNMLGKSEMQIKGIGIVRSSKRLEGLLPMPSSKTGEMALTVVQLLSD